MKIQSPIQRRRAGLILLVVLGMLALFSLLAVTYVLFSGHSRSASVALARSEIRDTRSNWRPSFEEAIMQLIRGTTDESSSLYGHDLLGDLYGDKESLGMPLVEIRNFQYDISGGPVVPMNYAAATLQRPLLIGTDTTNRGSYLRIPLNPINGGIQVLPNETDALTGRVVTFPIGNGPLSGQSFRVVRYIGAVDASAGLDAYSQRFSITIDLAEADLAQVHTQVDTVTNQTLTLTLAEWAFTRPSVPNNEWTDGVYLCYQGVGGEPNRLLGGGYSIYFNAQPLNSHGVGVFNDGSSQKHYLTTNPGSPLFNTEINEMSVGLQTRIQDLADNGTLVIPWQSDIQTTQIYGDSDEPHDAADFNNMFLSHRFENATASGDIIPSFHRAALINYIVNWKPLNEYTEAEFYATLTRIELAAGRPLSIDVTSPNGSRQVNASFTGSTAEEVFGGVTHSPQLSFTVANPWNTNWPGTGLPRFVEWLNHLTTGPWDVDNDGDGIQDSVWVDIGLPLQSSPDGKLLKTLVAYYVDDLDKRLDVNAASSVAQSNMDLNGTYMRYGVPTSTVTNTNPVAFAKGPVAHLSQGLGFGPADTSMRHLFGKRVGGSTYLTWGGNIGDDWAELAYQEMMITRYRENPSSRNANPGMQGDDPISVLSMRERRNGFLHGVLPGLPVATHGRASYGLDWLGNVGLWNIDASVQQGVDDPYEARLLGSRHQDSPFTIAEWERIYRVGDSDRTNLPARLQTTFGETENTLTQSSLKHEITTISRHLRAAKLAARKRAIELEIRNNANAPHPFVSPQTFQQLLSAVLDMRGETVPFNEPQMLQLFPLEFSRGVALNLNRAFGDGVDNATPGAPPVPANGEIDEPFELAYGLENAWYPDGNGQVVRTTIPEDYFYGQTGAGYNVDPTWQADNGGVLSGLETRQLFARHLYCLAQLLVPGDYVFPNVDRTYYRNLLADSDPDAATKVRHIRARTLAQWAVNVVDYRDSDATMTRFPYDVTPFVDGNSDGQYWEPNQVVWGLEQPELVITESLATHDVRVKKSTSAQRLDQYRTPEGSLFLEFYCPRTTRQVNNGNTSVNEAGVPTGLYSTDANNQMVLNLSRLAPGGAPVWRVYVSGPVGDRQLANPQHKTPHARLLAPHATDLDTPSRNDMAYQLAVSNISDTDDDGMFTTLTIVRDRSGLEFDYARTTNTTSALSALPFPDDADVEDMYRDARVIVFAPGFSPTKENSPGVLDPESQVYVKQIDSNPVELHGNQYLVVGPRPITYFGSRTTAAGATPVNHPNRHRIQLTNTWTNAHTLNGSLARTYGAAPFPFKPSVNMVAGALLPATWSDLQVDDPSFPDVKDYVGINVSERSPGAYYRPPGDRGAGPLAALARLNPNDADGDVDDGSGPSETGAPGFEFADADAYNDYALTPDPGPLRPFDAGTTGPLEFWDLNEDGSVDTVGLTADNSDSVVRPGTIQDWCTAYLQRLADPRKAWHDTYNPYITVDWIPVDLTVFSGEENDTALAPPAAGQTGEIRFASRQKVGQTLDAITLEFDDGASGERGQTFLSYLSVQGESTESGAGNFFNHVIPLDTPSEDATRPALADGSQSLATLGYLNNHFRFVTRANVPFEYAGAPADPDNGNPNWHADTIFWTNRPFINPIEIAFVPLSGPGQLMQEFSGTDDSASIYAPAYARFDANGMPIDPRMPAAPVSTAITAAEVDPMDWPVDMRPEWSSNANPTPVQGDSNLAAYYPYTHLLNFFQEVPEVHLPRPELTYPQNFKRQHPKNTSLALLMELSETESPWIDSAKVENPSRFAARTGSFGAALQAVVTANNQIFATHRAPYNRISRFVEPGRVNLNTVAEANVFQGLWSNTLEPSDIDFPPYASIARPFGQVEDVDYDNDDVQDAGGRARPGNVAVQCDLFRQSRRGYEARDGNYNPGQISIPLNTRFNPNFPTEFAGLYKPASEAGMVPETRNPFPPVLNVTNPSEGHRLNLHRLAEKGVLDMYSRQVPVHNTLMRGGYNAPVSGTPEFPVGLSQITTLPLFSDTTSTPRHAFTDMYPMSRLSNLTTERSNTFAVYVTLGLFEYDPTAGIQGEYGAERGEVERAKAFYVIDRTLPVGYRVGQDENAGKTILVRRILNE